jgi:hypothetical protein
MTSGFNLEKVGWRLSLCSGLFWSLPGSLLLFPGSSTAVGGTVLSEVFTWRQRLPLWNDEMDGLASPLYQPMAHSRLPREQGLPIRHRLVLSRWWSALFVGGKEASRGSHYQLEVLSSLVPIHGISRSKMGSYQAVITP